SRLSAVRHRRSTLQPNSSPGVSGEAWRTTSVRASVTATRRRGICSASARTRLWIRGAAKGGRPVVDTDPQRLRVEPTAYPADRPGNPAPRSRLLAARRKLHHPEVWLADDDAPAVVGQDVAGLHGTPVWAHVGCLELVHGQLDGLQAAVAGALAHERGALVSA